MEAGTTLREAVQAIFARARDMNFPQLFYGTGPNGNSREVLGAGDWAGLLRGMSREGLADIERQLDVIEERREHEAAEERARARAREPLNLVDPDPTDVESVMAKQALDAARADAERDRGYMTYGQGRELIALLKRLLERR